MTSVGPAATPPPTQAHATVRRWPRIVVRWIRRTLVGVLGLAVLAVVAALIIIHTDWGREQVRAQIEQQLQAKFPGGARIGSLDGSVFGELVVRDVELDGRDHKAMLAVKEVRVELALWKLLSATAHVDRVRVDGVVIDIHPQPPAPAEPAPAEPAPAEPTTATSAWRVELPDVLVTNARASVTTASGTIELVDVDAGAWFVMPRHHPIAAIASVRGFWRGRPMVAAVVADYDGSELAVPYAALNGAGANVAAIDVRVGPSGIHGAVTARAAARTVAELAPVDAAMVPGDVLAVVDAEGDHIGLDATIGAARLYARGKLDVETTTARGIVSLTTDDLTNLTRGAVSGRGTLAVAATVSPKQLRGILGVAGAVVEPAESRVTVAFDGAADRAEIVAIADRARGSHATITAEVVRKAGQLSLTRARVLAVARELPAVGGTFYVDADAHGPLTPTPALTVDAEVDGEAVRFGATSAAGVQAHVTGYQVPSRSTGHVRLNATDVRSGASAVPQVTVEADIAATSDGGYVFDQVTHQLRTAAGTWTGSGGRVAVASAAKQFAVAVTDLHTGTGASALTITRATFAPDTGDLAATVTAKDVVLAAALPGTPGSVDAQVDVARRRNVWSGKLHVDARGVGTAELPVDATLDVAVSRGNHLAIAAHAEQARAGDVTLSVDLDGPRDLADVDAWRRLGKQAIRKGDIALHGDAAAVGATGRVVGQLAIVDGDLRGTLHADDVHAGPEVASADVAIAPGDNDELVVTATTRVADVVAPHAVVRVAVPAHVFDPAAWRAVDRTALRAATITLDDTAVDPHVLHALGAQLPYSAHVAATIKVAAAAAGLGGKVTVSQLAGGAVVSPLDVTITGGIDGDGAHATLDAVGLGKLLVQATVNSPLTLARAIAGGAPTAPIDATVTTPELSAKELLALVGRDEVTAGTIHAAVDVHGSIAKPTGNLDIQANGIVMAPPLAGQIPPALAALDVSAKWDGSAGELDVTAHEVAGELTATVRGRPDELAKADATLAASAFDVAPLAAFAPGALAAVTGTITTARLAYDPKAETVSGDAHLVKTSVPLSALLGTFRDGDITVAVDGDHVHTVVAGKLGEGTVTADATLALAGTTPKSVRATATLQKVSPLGAIRPKVNASIKTDDMAYDPAARKWTGTIAVTNADASVSLKFADDLFPVGQPDDMVFVDAPPKPAKQIHIPQPSAPWLDVRIALDPMTIEAHDPSAHGVLAGVLGVVRATIETAPQQPLELLYGDDGIGLIGKVQTDQGHLDLVGRPYDVEVGELMFDGPIYPKVNFQLSHSFPDLTLTVGVQGEAPSELKIEPTSDVPGYSQDQLWSFVFGGDPSGDPANAAQDAGAAAGAAIASGIGSTYLNRGLAKAHIPVKLDVLKYNAGTASSSASYEVGKWLKVPFGSLLALYRLRQDALPTENINEGEAEYYVGKHWIGDVDVGDRGYDTADVLYRLRW